MTRGSSGGRSARRRPLDDSAAGWAGWDSYAPFYDWENARTVGRRDVRFWRALVQREGGPVLELGCGTGRIGVPLTGTGSTYVGIDRSEPMLVRGRRRLKRVGRFVPGALVRGDIRTLPFADRTFRVAVAPYGILQSLLSDRALASALREVARTLEPGGVFGLDLVPDVPQWNEYRRRVSLTGTLGRQGAPVTLVESVRQDRKRRLTIFDQEYVVGRGRARERHCFSLTFRTIGLDGLRGRLERAGFSVTAVLGDYRGGPWDERADAWIVLATRLAS